MRVAEEKHRSIQRVAAHPCSPRALFRLVSYVCRAFPYVSTWARDPTEIRSGIRRYAPAMLCPVQTLNLGPLGKQKGARQKCRDPHPTHSFSALFFIMKQ